MFIETLSRLLRAKVAVLTVVALRLSACGPAAQSPKDHTGTTDPTELALHASYLAPETARTIAAQGGRIGLQAVAAASQAGRLVTTGTFTESAQRWTYDAQPTDRMVIATSDGMRVEYVFETIEGSGTSSVDNFLSANHRLVFEISSETSGELRVQSVRAGQNREVEITGSLIVTDQPYTVDLNLSGQDYFENDSTGTEYRDQYRTSGTVQAEDYHLTVDESWQYISVSANGESVSNATKIANSGLTAKGTHYQWDSCSLQKSFRDGQPSEVDYWQASGGLLRNGEIHGQCGFYSTDFSVGFALYLESTEWIIEEWTLPNRDD